MGSGMNRRQFLARIGAGAAVVSLPAAFPGCARDSRMIKPASGAGAHGTYFDQFGVSTELIRKIIAKGLTRGGDFAEVYLQHEIVHAVGMEDGAINRAYTSVDLGAGIRVLKGDATGYAYSEELTEKALLSAAETAAAIADSTPSIQVKPLAAIQVPNFYQVDVPWSEIGIDKRLPVIQAVDQKARARDKRVIKVTVYAIDNSSHILVANSDGVLAEDGRPMAMLYGVCVAQHKGKTEMGYEVIAARDTLRFFTDEKIDFVAHSAVDDTVALFDAVDPLVGEFPVVLGPGDGGVLLHEAMGHGFEADLNRKGISIYTGRIGKRIAPENVTIVDDATVPHLRGSLNVDDEGTPGEKTVLVENGILKSYLHDRISAQHYRVKSTGSARRESFRYPPVPRMRNTYMLAGTQKPEEIIASVKKGLYTEKFSNGQVNIGAGDFTFFLKKGRLIENGKLTHVVKDANLIGSGPKVLENVQMVGDDLAFESSGGTCGKDGQGVPVNDGMPTTKVGAISIGGRKS